jgi:predicted RNase H-like nuclease
VAGVDGCRAGWVVATVPAEDDIGSDPAGRVPACDVEIVADLGTVVERLVSGRLAAAAIDIPIGLAGHTARVCDAEARRLLGPRRSSVFPAPVRAVLGAGTYEEACETSRRASGRGISKQLFNILDKIRDVDRLQSPRLQSQLFEMHPELSFTVLAGTPMRFSKRTPEGRAERVAALRDAFGDQPRLTHDTPPSGANRDDVLDAMVGAWTARRYVARTHLRLGGELDGRGLRMEIVA